MRQVESGPRPLKEQLAPWAGFLLGGLGWFLHQQVGANTNYNDCAASGPLPVTLLGLLCLLLAGVGGWVSWGARRKVRGAKDWDLPVRSLLGEVGAGSAALFALAILYGMMAGLIVPECWK